MAEPPAGFAGVLRRLRAGAGLTQEELAEAAGVSPRTISDLERGLATTPPRTRCGCSPMRCSWAARPGSSSRRPRGATR